MSIEIRVENFSVSGAMDKATILISACEPSGDMHAASVISAVRRRLDVRFVGMGGPCMRDAGCQLLYDVSQRSGMLLGALGSLRWAVPAYRTMGRLIRAGRVDLVMLVDSPTFNLPLARKAKAFGLPTLYYIAPQVWAWGRFRVHKIRRRVDRLAVILPFEQQYFRSAGIPAQFVGHPFVERIRHEQVDSDLLQELNRRPRPRVLVMPGSRGHVMDELLPLQLQAAEGIARHFGQISLMISAWSDEAVKAIRRAVNKAGLEAEIRSNANATLIEAADVVLAASGTGTLQAAWRGKPMVVMYNASRVMYHLIGRWLIHTRWLSLINILAGKELVPEFMPYVKDIGAVQQAAIQLLTDEAARERMGRELRKVVESLYLPNGAEKVADMVAELLESQAAGIASR